MSHRIHQEITLAAPPARIYELLTDPDEFSRTSGGAPASIDPNAGGAFSLFGGMIHGVNVECAPGARLVQAWRVKSWEPGLYSLARFELRPEGDSTRLVFDHTGFPEDQADHLEKGWHANYWDPLAKRLG